MGCAPSKNSAKKADYADILPHPHPSPAADIQPVTLQCEATPTPEVQAVPVSPPTHAGIAPVDKYHEPLVTADEELAIVPARSTPIETATLLSYASSCFEHAADIPRDELQCVLAFITQELCHPRDGTKYPMTVLDAPELKVLSECH